MAIECNHDWQPRELAAQDGEMICGRCDKIYTPPLLPEPIRRTIAENSERRIVHALLTTFQEVLNWCALIEDEESRLPLDLVNKSHNAINAGTITFQPEMISPKFDAGQLNAEKEMEFWEERESQNWSFAGDED